MMMPIMTLNLRMSKCSVMQTSEFVFVVYFVYQSCNKHDIAITWGLMCTPSMFGRAYCCGGLNFILYVNSIMSHVYLLSDRSSCSLQRKLHSSWVKIHPRKVIRTYFMYSIVGITHEINSVLLMNPLKMPSQPQSSCWVDFQIQSQRQFTYNSVLGSKPYVADIYHISLGRKNLHK